jgi:hypothetical protein
VPIDALAPFSRAIPDTIADLAHPWSPIRAPIARQNFWNGDPEQPDEHQIRHPQHGQILKSP